MNGRSIAGLILIVIGASMFAKSVFGIELPIFEIVIPILLIFVGISMVISRRGFE